MVPNSKEHRIPVVYLITNKVNGKIKPVAQFDLQHNLIHVWDQAGIVSKQLGIAIHRIRKACSKKGQICGFIWEYIEDENLIEEVRSKVCQQWKEQHGTAIG